VTAETKKWGAILAIVAMISFGAWPFWKAIYFNAASAAIQERANELAAKNPALKTALEVAMVDGVLSQGEAELIVKGGE
jgi:hypothetical protein